ncbi:MAG TPA: family 43 glycosylhydrolase [Tepidisphaeraceae bacterium]|jgi:beta-xylosidase
MLTRPFLMILVLVVVAALGARALAADETLPHARAVAGASNPLLPGYFADPCVLAFEDRFIAYATIDPWGADTLGCWESADFKNWTFRELNWPTKKACTSPTSGGSKVWAPSVVRGGDGKFYMYVSVGSEVWVGKADHPLGPWENALGKQEPLIGRNYRPGFHMIDAEAFIDTDGTPYLYWGSGWGYKNGKCWAVRLKPDMTTFDSEVTEITPSNYFEGPVMMKRGGKYYLMYSQGNTTVDTYRVHYAVGDSPLGKFVEGQNSPILTTDKAAGVVSPGHHAMFDYGGESYIVYHLASLPRTKGTLRQTCIDRLQFSPDGWILPVVPTLDGAARLQAVVATAKPASAAATKLTPVAASASSEATTTWSAGRAIDANYFTRWMPAPDAAGHHWLQIDLGKPTAVRRCVLRPEYATRAYRFSVAGSVDGNDWTTLADLSDKGASGSPINVDVSGSWRFMRVNFAADVKPGDASLWEIAVE